ncbi:MAG TPA: hypothetical protein VG454_13110, partial [Gemmatimonadales bacterium]|nr:hypothetical protein [Gemmatimonadales bacterium]
LLVRANYIRMEFTLDAGDLATREQAEAVAARVAGSEASPECVALANMALGQIAISRGEPALALERLAAAAPVLESLGLLMELRRALATMGISYRGLGRFADAARTFRECVNVAERCGHLGSIAHSYGLLGNVYQDLAFFDAATETYRHVVASLEVLDSARAFAEAYSNVTRFALMLGNRREAEIALTRCEDGARRSTLWRHQVTALMARADVQLGHGRPDLAWPYVEQAAAIVGDRAHLLPDAGTFVRLQHHYHWATRGFDALRSQGHTIQALFDSVVEVLEVRLFDEAVAQIHGARTDSPALDEAVSTGLLGPLARLLATGVHHPGVPPRAPGESAAQLIARAFPHPQRTATAQALGLVG